MENHEPQMPYEEQEQSAEEGREWQECSVDGCDYFALAFSEYCADHVPDWAQYRKVVEGERESLSGANLARANLRETYLWEANLQWADLRQVNLRRAGLWSANLQRTVLQGVNAEEAVLVVANFQDANLVGANLQKALLYDADLRGADLSGADLRGANLMAADLRGTDLSGADLTGATINSETRFFSSRRFRILPEKVKAEKEKQYGTAERAYQKLIELYKSNGMSADAHKLYYRYRVCRRKRTSRLYLRRWPEWFFLDLLCGYGERPQRAVAWAVLVVVVSALVYSLFPNRVVDGRNHSVFDRANYAAHDSSFKNAADRYGTALYFSVVTFTTLGLSDYHSVWGDSPDDPYPLGRIIPYWVAGEAVSGALLITLALATYARVTVRDWLSTRVTRAA